MSGRHSPVHVEEADGITTVVLDDPGARNALSWELVRALSGIGGITAAFDAPRFHEAVLLLDRPVAPVLATLAEHGIAGGLDLAASYPELGHALLVCATETKTDADIERYERAMRAAIERPLRGAARVGLRHG